MAGRNSNYERDSLLGKFDDVESQRPASRWKMPQETDETKNLDNQEVLTMRSNKMDQQDKILDLLGDSIERQKATALGINQQVNEQLDIIDDLSGEVTKVQTRVEKATHQVNRITQKSSATCLWIVCAVVFLGLLGVIFASLYT
eukprot:TRINITY_DN9048_c0_g1_i1.p1 TRINITY_DN9048_c0_g1~~TRINITY_DN9048_c0_g1_i1.p1  ORF type:complete len:144 (-),score=24.23 TRINITY_DN9048_c0_g1_i1:78-509(-)